MKCRNKQKKAKRAASKYPFDAAHILNTSYRTAFSLILAGFTPEADASKTISPASSPV